MYGIRGCAVGERRSRRWSGEPCSQLRKLCSAPWKLRSKKRDFRQEAMKVDPHLAGMEQEVTKQEDWEGKKLEAGKPPNQGASQSWSAGGCSGLLILRFAAD